MTTETANANRTDADDTLAPSVIFELLCEDHRRQALAYLSRTVGAVDLADLIDWLARRDGEPTPERIDRLTLEFHHTHLRKLGDAAVVRYDAETERVERRAMARARDPYLELAAADQSPAR